MKNQILGAASKEEVEDREKKIASSCQNHLGPNTEETELRLGFSSSGLDGHERRGQAFSASERLSGGESFLLKQRNGGLGTKRWFSETRDGFESPWEEKKAVLDQISHGRVVGPPPLPRATPLIGWPPVRTFRKNLAPQSKPELETNPSPSSPCIEAPNKFEDSLFVKVNMEGYAVGRKINLKAHHSYESLSNALQNMFNNFFFINYSKKQEGNEKDVVITPDLVLIYEDNEGDRMLVGDVPWEMFISTVKRLYIISGSRAPSLVAERVEKKQQ